MAKKNTKNTGLEQSLPSAALVEQVNESLAQEVAGLKDMLSKLVESNKAQAPQSRFAERVKEHFATLREYEDEERNKWIIMGLSRVRDVIDPSHTRRVIAQCDVELLNPETKEKKVIVLEYLYVIRETLTVPARILKSKENVSISSYRGPVFTTATINDQVVEKLKQSDFLHEVKTVDYAYQLEIMGGAFAGLLLENDGNGLNI